YAWMAMMSSLNVSAQGAAPTWVRARVLAVYLLVFQGGTAIGSFGWGVLASAVGNSTTLAIAAGTLTLTTTAAFKWRLHRVASLDMTPARNWEEPELKVAPALEEGPVLVTVEYRVGAENVARFIEAMQSVGRMRKRTGAYEWELYSDPTQTDRYVETFLARTWAEHLRQHTRPTITDQQVQERALEFVVPGTEPVISHYIATHSVRAGRVRGR
ncbi:MAG: MFS transporter, partial [Chloroflexia bacterium]